MAEDFFYILAFQRSGTTLLSYLLDAHPEVVCVDEFELGKRLIYGQPELLADVTFSTNRKVLGHYGVSAEEYGALCASFLSRAIGARQFIERAHALCNRKGARVVGGKEVCDIEGYRHDFVRRLLGLHENRVKVVFIERDIKGVVASFLKLGFLPPGRRKISPWRLRRFAHQYVRAVNYLGKYVRRCPEMVSITYEDLMASPETALGKVFSFLNVRNSADVIELVLRNPGRGPRQAFTGIQPELAEDWRRLLTPAQVRMLDQAYGRRRKMAGVER